MKTVQKLFYNLNYQIFIKKNFESSNDAEENPFGEVINKTMLLLYYFKDKIYLQNWLYPKATTLLNIFLLDVTFDKSIMYYNVF